MQFFPATSRAGKPQAIVLGLLGTAAILAPLPLGSTGEWSRFALEAAMALAVAIWVISSQPHLACIALPVGVAAIFLLQLVPLPESVLGRVAPLSAGVWKVALQAMPAKSGSISIVPAETRAGIARLFLGLATIMVVADASRRAVDRRWLLYPVAFSAALMLALGLLFPVDVRDKIVLGFIDLKGPSEFWRSPIPAPVETSGWAYLDWTQVGDLRYSTDLGLTGDGFGPFISTNSFAGAIYLTLPALLAIVLRVSRAKLPTGLQYFPVVLLLTAATGIVGLLAKSRAGAGGLLFGGLVFMALTVRSVPLRRALGVLTVLAGVVLLAFTLTFHGFLDGFLPVFPQSVESKLASLQSDGRRLASHIAMRIFSASPVLGTGLGSYGDLNAQMSDGKHVWYFAHNDYAQFLAESGIVGLGSMIAAAAVMVLAARRFAAVATEPDRTEIAAGWAALAGLAVQSAFDWNMHLPATGFLACVMAGIAISPWLSSVTNAADEAREPNTIRRRVAPGLLIAAATLAIVPLWHSVRAEAAAQGLRQAMADLKLPENKENRPAADQGLLSAMTRGERVLANDASQATVAVLLGQANLRLAQRQTNPTAAAAYELAADRAFQQARAHRPFVRGIAEPAMPRRPKS